MENLSQETRQELKKVRYHLYTLDGAYSGHSFHTRNGAEKMQALYWKRNRIAYQIISKKINK